VSLRILLVSHRFPPDGVAGVERYTESLGAELVRRGHDVSVVTRRPGRSRVLDAKRERRRDGVRVHRLSGGDVRLDNFLVHHDRLEELFAATLVEEAPDVVHVNHLLGLSPRFVDLAQRLRVPVVLSLHDFFVACPLAHLEKTNGALCLGPDGGRECAATCFAPEGPAARLRWGVRTAYFRRLLARAERVVCPPGHLARFFSDFGGDRVAIEEVSLGIGLAASAPATPPSPDGAALTLAFFGIVTRHKGLHLVIDALAAASLGPVKLRVLGRTPDAAYARSLRRAAARVPDLELRMFGEYAPAQLPQLLGGVDAAVMPSLVPEAFPLSPREAIALGVPVIGSTLGGLPEIVVHGVNGLVVDVHDSGALRECLRRLAVDRDLRTTLRAGARATRVETIADHTDAIVGVYESVIREPRRPPVAAARAESDNLFGGMIQLGMAAR
jgi:glycosyltransferase involved in cell wall biosynthesis